MKKHTQFTLAALVAGVWSLPASAIVNIEDMRVGVPKSGYSGNLDLGISGKNGNSDKSEVAIDSRLQNHRDKTTDFVIFSYDYGESSNQRNANSTFLHGRHVMQLRQNSAWEAFVQAEQNEFTRLSLRALAGGGLRFTLKEAQDWIGIYAGIGAFYVRETLEQQPGLTDHGSDNFARASFYISYKHQLNSQVSLASTTYYQPRLDDGEDYRALEQATLAVKMSDSLALKLSLDISHDSKPPQTVDNTDISYMTAISYQF